MQIIRREYEVFNDGVKIGDYHILFDYDDPTQMKKAMTTEKKFLASLKKNKKKKLVHKSRDYLVEKEEIKLDNQKEEKR